MAALLLDQKYSIAKLILDLIRQKAKRWKRSTLDWQGSALATLLRPEARLILALVQFRKTLHLLSILAKSPLSPLEDPLLDLDSSLVEDRRLARQDLDSSLAEDQRLVRQDLDSSPAEDQLRVRQDRDSSLAEDRLRVRRDLDSNLQGNRLRVQTVLAHSRRKNLKSRQINKLASYH